MWYDIFCFPEKIENGIKWLNKYVPDWLGRINIDELNMNSCWKCILGQLFGEYLKAVTRMGITDHHAEMMGFEILDYAEYKREDLMVYLTDLWRDAILRLRTNA